MRLCLFVLPLTIIQLSQVVESRGGIRMLRTQDALSNGQRAFQKRFGLLVFPEQTIQLSQIIATRGGIRILSAQHLLSDGQRAFQQRLGLSIESTFSQIPPCMSKQARYFRGSEPILVNKVGTGLGMQQIPLT